VRIYLIEEKSGGDHPEIMEEAERPARQRTETRLEIDTPSGRD